ncbi:NAD(P)-dependent oxidoreductase [Roseicitreum antarcticum]|uniref:D-3-phosphoglycerate dehydrogenase n=1 Tax=Roseicitreum antarcticum TaxID=564137 RepID=A0A1H2X0J4_9RHOB|nr:NAD(P)-dependent oxidoreductase [Roseicitreum antarcticum]SDW86034.1 D-3-phosphoglycerate dehydrogenase [Roseicitreum antarcticum]
MKSVLVTCPPMLGMIDEFYAPAKAQGIALHAAQVTQIMSVEELIATVPGYDGWIIGDDPATAEVFEAATKGQLRAAVKWGVGVDNVDFAACKRLGLPIINTPGVFGREVADLAMQYVTALARESYTIDRGVRTGSWPKPRGHSLWSRRAAVVGYGDIGRNTVKRLLAHDVTITVVDPFCDPATLPEGVRLASWPAAAEGQDYLVFTAPLTPDTQHMFSEVVLPHLKPGVRVVNVGRGPVISEAALVAGLKADIVHSAALDVFEVEPLPTDSPLRAYQDRLICGSHNGSNTEDAVRNVSLKAIGLIAGFFADATRQ